MNRHVLLATVLLGVAGCSQRPEAAQPATTSQAAAVPATAAAAPCEEPTGYQWQPADLAFDLPYHLRADRIYGARDESSRRRVVLEFLEGTPESVLASVEQAMLAAGFQARPRREPGNGNLIAPFAKKGYGSIAVVINGSAGDNPSHPEAKGTIAFDYPVAPAGRETPTPSPAATPAE